MREVAERAKVSVATVSAVINNTKRITPEVRARVLKAMEELNYRPNALARSLFAGKSKTIAFLVPTISNPAFSDNLFAIEKYANERGYAVFIANTRGSRELVENYVNRLIEMRVAGVITALTWELSRQELVDQFARFDIKVVGCSGGRSLDSIDCFLVDERKAGYDLGKYLIGLGHERCAYIGPKDSAVGTLRFEGLKEAYESAGIELLPTLISWTDSYEQDASERAAYQLIARGEPFSCVVVFNDFAAMSVLQVLKNQGLLVPQHVSLATFGDYYAKLTSPRLTTMAHDDYVMGKQAVQKLLQSIEGDVTEPSVHFIHKEPRIRESTIAVARPWIHSSTL